MKKTAILILILTLAAIVCASQNAFKEFVYVKGDKLMDENGELKFISFNIPCLHYNEDNMAFDQTNPWRLSNEFEISDALEAVRQMGGQVIRTYTLSVRRKGEDSNIPRHITGPGQFDEKTFISLDYILAVANQKGIRVIIPFIDNWKWWGGIPACADFRGKNTNDFWTDRQLFEDYKQIVSFVINRTNTVTGVKYKDDKAILAWETGNELSATDEWTAKAAAFIKSIDKNHLVIDGFHTTILKDSSLQDKNIDIVTTHHYSKNPQDTISQIKKNAEKSRSKKPYFVGEFGFIPTKDVESILNTIQEQKISGALIWSLRFRNRDGGFYWHSEPYGGDLFKAYHWPGFDSGNPYDERNLMSLMRNRAFEIRNLPVPSLEIPDPPLLLDIIDSSQISFQGSAGAQSYIVERATNEDGPWSVCGKDISDAAVQYQPLFADTATEPNIKYYYRVRAKNAAGTSEPSNVVGPVYAPFRTLVDEMQDLNLIYEHKGRLSLETKEARRFKEDIHRLQGKNKTSITYKLSEPVVSWKLYAFFPDNIHHFNFFASEDGKKFKKIKYEYKDYNLGKGDYGYYRPVLYTGLTSPENYKYLKIEYTASAQIGRVEIKYGKWTSRFHHTYSPIGFIKGFSWGWTGWRGQYLGDAPADSMKKLAETGSNWVCISFGADMEKPDIPEIQWGDSYKRMVTDAEIRRAIQLARDNNLKVILKPVVNVYDGTWRAFIKFDDLPGIKNQKKWDKWWSDFRAFLLHYAKIAEETNCEMLCLGCEMGSTEEFDLKWRNLINDVKQIYGGTITYDVNHGREDKISWFDALDVISISAYYPVGTDDVLIALKDDLSKIPPSNNSIDALKRRWLPIKERLEKISKKLDRPIFFIELGMCNAKGCSAAPWTHEDPNMVYDVNEQVRYYQATLETFWNEPWFIGFTWWSWHTDLYDIKEAASNISFSIYGKPAEKVVRQWYGKER